jgi:hypothetical protein
MEMNVCKWNMLVFQSYIKWYMLINLQNKICLSKDVAYKECLKKMLSWFYTKHYNSIITFLCVNFQKNK